MVFAYSVLATLFPFLAILPVSVALTACVVNGKTYHVDSIVTRDVTIIGGGSAGTYSAIRLTDLGKSVTVVEQDDRLGGNTQTYTDPATGKTVEYGVQVFHQFPVVTNYFTRLNVSWTIIPIGTGVTDVTQEYADFTTGQHLNFSQSDFSTALTSWGAFVAQYPDLDLGWYLPDPVPADFLLPIGEFLTKYGLEAMALFTWGFTQGVGDLMTKPTIYLMKYLGLSSLENVQTGYLTTALGDNSLLYLSAQKILGTNVYYKCTILSVQRDDHGVQVVIKQGTKNTLIKSAQLIIAIPPTLKKLAPFDITHQENRLFEQWTSNEYFSALMRHTGVPNNVSVTNISPGAPFSVPSPPCIYSIGVTSVEGLNTVTYLSTTPTTGNTIPDAIIEQIKNVQVPGKGESEPEFAVSSNHRPFELSVSVEAIKWGFYRELYGLQGKKRTWWTGAAWHAHDSSLIWRFTEGLLGNVTAAL